MPRKVPLSILLFTLRIHEMKVALVAQSPTRHPGMLWLLLIELNSMQHSLAPGTCNSDFGWWLRINE